MVIVAQHPMGGNWTKRYSALAPTRLLPPFTILAYGALHYDAISIQGQNVLGRTGGLRTALLLEQFMTASLVTRQNCFGQDFWFVHSIIIGTVHDGNTS